MKVNQSRLMAFWSKENLPLNMRRHEILGQRTEMKKAYQLDGAKK